MNLRSFVTIFCCLSLFGCFSQKTPSETEVLAAANELAANTLVVVAAPAEGDIEQPCLSAIKADNLEVSLEGTTCIVVFDLAVSYLPAFRIAKGVSIKTLDRRPQLTQYLHTCWWKREKETRFPYLPYDPWDEAWYSSERNKSGSTFRKIKIRMRKWDSGWKFEDMP